MHLLVLSLVGDVHDFSTCRCADCPEHHTCLLLQLLLLPSSAPAKHPCTLYCCTVLCGAWLNASIGRLLAVVAMTAKQQQQQQQQMRLWNLAPVEISVNERDLIDTFLCMLCSGGPPVRGCVTCAMTIWQCVDISVHRRKGSRSALARIIGRGPCGCHHHSWIRGVL